MDFKDIIFWLKNKLFRRAAISLYDVSRQNETLSIENLNLLNWEKRRKIVEYAYNNIPFYRKFYNSKGFNPSMLKTERDWDLIPVVEKDMIRQHMEDFKDKSVSSKYLGLSSTGGSTGVPLKLYHDLRFPYEVLSWRMLSWWNLSPGCDKALVFRVPAKRTHVIQKIKDIIIWWPTKRIKLDASVLSENDIRSFIKKVNKLKPDIILGYVGALEQIALFIKQKGLTIISPKILWATSAPMSQVQKSLFAQIFKCPILDQYGSCEIMWIASNCNCTDNLHLYFDFRHIDIVDENDKILPVGNMGTVLITDLENYAFPLIKYRNGDRSSFVEEKCSCGRSLPLITPIKGRISEVIFLPNNEVLSGEFLTTIFDDYIECIDKFQIIQKKDYSIELNLMINKNADYSYCMSQIKKVENALESKIQKQVLIKVNIVDEILNDKGKIRYIVSELTR